jgi:transcription factor Dp-1
VDASASAEPASPPASAVKRGSGAAAATPPAAPGSAAKRRKTAGAPGAAPGSAASAPASTPGDEKDKNGKGLRHFSMKVCEKVESKQTTTYNEVADELVAEFSKPDDPAFCADQAYDEKNIRRRVYDALNVLMAMNIIAKRKKEIMWKGLPATGDGDVAHLRAEKARARASIEKKNAYLLELVEQYKSYQALLQRNAARAAVGVVPSGIQLPFILVQTKPNATVEVEISEDQQVVHFDFNSTPFQIHDGNFVLAQMNLTENSMANLNLEAEKAKSEPINGHGLNGGDDALVGELVGGPSAHGSPKGKVKGKVKGEATEPEVKVEGGGRRASRLAAGSGDDGRRRRRARTASGKKRCDT